MSNKIKNVVMKEKGEEYDIPCCPPQEDRLRYVFLTARDLRKISDHAYSKQSHVFQMILKELVEAAEAGRFSLRTEHETSDWELKIILSALESRGYEVSVYRGDASALTVFRIAWGAVPML